MATYLELGPAYGRDYKSQKEVLEAWNADKDFRVNEGARYGAKTNRRDILNMRAGGEDIKVTIRYDRNLKVMAIK